MTKYAIPKIELITDGNLTYPEPRLDQNWSDGQKLAWKAGCVQAETGLTITIRDADQKKKRLGIWIRECGLYSVGIRGPKGTSAGGGHSFRSAWDFLNGVAEGVHVVVGDTEHERSDR